MRSASASSAPAVPASHRSASIPSRARCTHDQTASSRHSKLQKRLLLAARLGTAVTCSQDAKAGENTCRGHIPRIRNYERAWAMVKCLKSYRLFFFGDIHAKKSSLGDRRTAMPGKRPAIRILLASSTNVVPARLRYSANVFGPVYESPTLRRQRRCSRSCQQTSATGMCCELEDRDARDLHSVDSRAAVESEEATNERGLPRDVVLGQPSHLTLTDHVYGLDP
jgi:hypothetical protein